VRVSGHPDVVGGRVAETHDRRADAEGREAPAEALRDHREPRGYSASAQLRVRGEDSARVGIGAAQNRQAGGLGAADGGLFGDLEVQKILV
jgi:hypothetical protein